MKVGLDCRLSGVRHAGIGRYVLNLAQWLPKLAPDIEWVYWVGEQDQIEELGVGDQVDVRLAPIRHYGLVEQVRMPGYFTAGQVDLLHVPHFNVPLTYRGRYVITIHDLLWHEQRGQRVTTLPAWQYWFKYLGYRFITARAIDRAQRIFVPAETVKTTLVERFPTAAEKIVITKEGVTPLGSPRKLTQSTPPKRPTLVYVGSLYPHKNLRVVLDALKLEPSWRLIVVGARDVFATETQRQAQEMGVADQVEWRGRVSDSELGTLFGHVTALVQPSLSEGFGLTGVEAMAAGLPVLASDIPIFREVYGEAAVFFDPHRPASLVAALEELMERRPTLSSAGRKWSKQYSWRQMAEETIAAYRQALRARS